MNPASLLELKPTTKSTVYDLVGQMGVDTRPWHYRKDGGLVEHPAANPAYCYEWVFGDESGISVLTLWHDYMTVVDDEIVYSRPILTNLNSKRKKLRTERLVQRIERLAKTGKMFRVIIVSGDVVPDDKLDDDDSQVSARELDQKWWYVKKLSRIDGEYTLARTLLTADHPEEVPLTTVIDDLPVPDTLNKPSARYTTLVEFVRSSFVRDMTRERARYTCELCDNIGFLMDDGSRFIECHHILPLSEGGIDDLSNTTALCPTCHREAHFSTSHRRSEIRQVLANRRSSDWS